VSFWGKNDENYGRQDDKSITTSTTKPENSVMTTPYNNKPVEKSADHSEDSDLPYGKIRSALGAGTIIEGKLLFDSTVRIDGQLKGEVSSSKALIVGPEGVVDAEFKVAALIVMGKVSGQINAKDRVEILAGGSITGDVKAPIFIIKEGGEFEGNCSMSKD